jgi:hypothetical protein
LVPIATESEVSTGTESQTALIGGPEISSDAAAAITSCWFTFATNLAFNANGWNK